MCVHSVKVRWRVERHRECLQSPRDRVKRKAVHGFYVFSFGVRRGVRWSDVGSHKEDA